MSHWNSPPDRNEDLRHSDPFDEEQREAIEKFYERERRDPATAGWQWRLALLLAAIAGVTILADWLVRR